MQQNDERCEEGVHVADGGSGAQHTTPHALWSLQGWVTASLDHRIAKVGKELRDQVQSSAHPHRAC